MTDRFDWPFEAAERVAVSLMELSEELQKTGRTTRILTPDVAVTNANELVAACVTVAQQIDSRRMLRS